MSLTITSRKVLLLSGFLSMCIGCTPSIGGSDASIPAFELKTTGNCMDLTHAGLSKSELNSNLIEEAIADAKKTGKDIQFYKALATKSSNSTFYYVFSIARTDDIYYVYMTDKESKSFQAKFVYGDLHYSPNPGSFDDCDIEPKTK